VAATVTEHTSLGVLPRDIPGIVAVTANAFEFDACLVVGEALVRMNLGNACLVKRMKINSIVWLFWLHAFSVNYEVHNFD
jgi:hypothetical protein